MSPEQGDSAGTIRLQLGDGRQIPFRLGPETWQLYYGGARRDEASELTELAQLADLVARELGPIGPHRDTDENAGIYRRGALLYVDGEAGADDPETALENAIEADPVLREDAGTAALQAAVRMPAVADVLRHRHPDFDGKSRDDKIKLLMRSAQHLDRAWWALRAFQEFVQAGRPGGRSTRRSPDPQSDVRAAELKDALGLTHREIGEILRVPLTETDINQGGQRQVGHMIERGRELLKGALGEAGYDAHIKAVKADLLRRHSLGGQDRLVLRMMELTAGLTGRTAEETEVLRGAIERLVEKHFLEY